MGEQLPTTGDCHPACATDLSPKDYIGVPHDQQEANPHVRACPKFASWRPKNNDRRPDGAS